MRQWRIHKSKFATVYTSGVMPDLSDSKIIMDDAFTGEELQHKTIDSKYLPYIEELGTWVIDLILNPDVLMSKGQVNNTMFTILNDQYNPSFIFPKYSKALIECCYIVAHRLGSTLQEIGYTRSQSGYHVRFVGVGSWAV